MDKGNFNERLHTVAEMVGGQAELSRRTGISKVTINSYALGKSDPSRSRLIAMADAAGVSVGWLAAGEGTMTGSPPGLADADRDPFLLEVGRWLQELAASNPDYLVWFRVEFARKFDGFRQWRDRKTAPAAPPAAE